MPRCAQGRNASLLSPHRAVLQPCGLETKVGGALVVRGENSSVSVALFVISLSRGASRSLPGRLF
jgi:hypothetical protein